MAPKDLDGLLLGPSDVGLPPAAGPSAILVLDQKVTAPNFSLALVRSVGTACGAAVVLGHVDLEGLRVGPGRRLPAGLFRRGIEIVREVLGVGVTDLPARWKTGFSLDVRTTLSKVSILGEGYVEGYV